jgi:small subunit ribosomal protein S17
MTETATPEADAPPADSAARRLRKTRVGQVVSAKMNKTIVVEVIRRVPHAKFKKIIKRTTKFYAHDEKSEAREGQRVRIMETRPISKLKRWRLVEVLAN